MLLSYLPGTAACTAAVISGVIWEITSETNLETSSPCEEDWEKPRPEEEVLSKRLPEFCELNPSILFDWIPNWPEDDKSELKVFPVCDENCESDSDEEDPTAFWTARATWGWIAIRICWTRSELNSAELDCELREEDELEDELEEVTDNSEVALFTCFCQISWGKVDCTQVHGYYEGHLCYSQKLSSYDWWSQGCLLCFRSIYCIARCDFFLTLQLFTWWQIPQEVDRCSFHYNL